MNLAATRVILVMDIFKLELFQTVNSQTVLRSNNQSSSYNYFISTIALKEEIQRSIV